MSSRPIKEYPPCLEIPCPIHLIVSHCLHKLSTDILIQNQKTENRLANHTVSITGLLYHPVVSDNFQNSGKLHGILTCIAHAQWDCHCRWRYGNSNNYTCFAYDRLMNLHSSERKSKGSKRALGNPCCRKYVITHSHIKSTRAINVFGWYPIGNKVKGRTLLVLANWKLNVNIELMILSVH